VKAGSVGRAGGAGRDPDTSQAFQGPDNTITLICSGTVASIDSAGLRGVGWVRWKQGERRGPELRTFVIITFRWRWTARYRWRVPDASAWHFINGHPLVAPLSGDF